jgi:tetratricopeptide (TPR) repeat protein
VWGASLANEPTVASQQKLQLLLEQARQRGAASAAGSTAVQALPSPARLLERTQLLASAEAALARSDVATALQAFERAALITHAADTEMGLVRTYMQAGQYRRALAFGAHTAGTHLDAVGGAALYAWLLQIGGQEAPAKRMLADALTRSPDHPLLLAAHQQLQSGQPLAQGALLQAPVRMAPFGPQTGIPRSARVAGSGVLFDHGKRVLVPLGTVRSSHRLWVRNGLGQLAPALLDKKFAHLYVATLKLGSILAADTSLSLAEKDAFAGSVAFAVEYTPSPSATPQWPVLSTGFLGEPSADGKTRALGILLAAGPRGGAVFDQMGNFVGMALATASGQNQLVTASQLRTAVGEPMGKITAAPVRERMPIDTLYELALQHTVQIIRTPGN